jgi:hypothetical protein
MGIKIGEIDVVDTAINTEFRLAVLEQVIDKLITVAPIGAITPQDIQIMRDKALTQIKAKYPNSGIHQK